jgi:hypothetical protein
MTLKTFASKKYSRKNSFCKRIFPEPENEKARRESLRFSFLHQKRGQRLTKWVCGPSLFFGRTAVLFPSTKGEQVGLLAPLLEGKKPILWYNRGLEVE